MNEWKENSSTKLPVNDDTTIAALVPLSPMHEWEKRLSDILNEILDVLESGKDYGYFDSIIDVRTHAVLIKMAMDKYVEQHNKRWAKHNDVQHVPNPKLIHTEDEIRAQNRGGYDSYEFERVVRLLK